MPAPKKYPPEVRERAVRMVFEIRQESGTASRSNSSPTAATRRLPAHLPSQFCGATSNYSAIQVLDVFPVRSASRRWRSACSYLGAAPALRIGPVSWTRSLMASSSG